LKIKDVDIDKDLIEIVRAKTSTPLSIPLNETSRAIWRKYSKDKNFKRKDGNVIDTHFLFPRFDGSNKFLSNANTNLALKRIGEVLQKHLSNMVNVEVRSGSGFKAGTDEEYPLYKKLHTHMGRKTFITFALSEKISPLDIKRISGHSDEKMMKYYVNSLRDEVVEQFQNMDVFMGKGKYVGPKNKKDTPKKVEAKSNKSVKDVLTELKNLLVEDLITNEEYEQKRKEILKRI
jgi:integrase